MLSGKQNCQKKKILNILLKLKVIFFKQMRSDIKTVV